MRHFHTGLRLQLSRILPALRTMYRFSHCHPQDLRQMAVRRLYCIVSDGSCVGDGSCGVSDRKDRAWDAVKYPIMLVIHIPGYC